MMLRRVLGSLLIGLLIPVGMWAQTPTSFDVDRMEQGDDPVIEAQRSLAKARKALRKAEGLQEKGATQAKIEKYLERALEDSEHAVALDPVLAEAKVVKGEALLQLGRPREALEACTSAVRWAPELVDGRVCAAKAYLATDQAAAASKICDELEAMKGDDAKKAATEVRAAIQSDGL